MTEQTDIEEVLGIDDSSRGFGRRWRTVLWLGVAVVLIAAAFIVWRQQGSTPSVQYVGQPATRGDLTVTVTATGTVQPTNIVEISSELSGVVKTVSVDFNDQVKQGEALAQLDTDKLKAEVARSRAGVAASQAKVKEAEATITETKRKLDRLSQLARNSFVSQQDLDAAQAAYDRAVASEASAQADVKVSQADLQVNETNLEKACICSPIDGIVLTRNVEPGQTVAASLQAPVLFTLADDLRKMELQVDVDEADIGKVKDGQPATFTVEAYQDRTFPATISELRFSSQTVEGVVTYKAVLSIDNSDLLLRPGMTATAEIVVEQVKDAVLVPNAALRFSPPAQTETTSNNGGILSLILPHRPQRREVPNVAPSADGKRRIWVLKDGTAHALMIATGVTDGSMTQVLSDNLAAGDSVIVDARAQ